MAKVTKTKSFKTIGSIIADLAELFRPPERLSVSQAAEKYVYLNTPGAYVGPYKNETAPYMVEPMDTMTARDKSGIAFVGPAQCAKTQCLLLNFAAYSIKVDPMDMILYCPTSTAARDFSMRRIDRMHRYSKEVGAMLMQKRDSDNTFDKHYTTGQILTMSYPSVTEMAGRPVGRIMLTDFDRMPEDVDGDGNPYDLASKRTTTFGSFAMTVAESSPSRPITDPKWIPTSLHEAPPTTGILALYNRGDRRKWYWPCPHCDEYFEGKFKLLVWDENLDNNLDKAETTRMACPHCGCLIHPDERYEMQLWGRWVKDGQAIDKNGRIYGPPIRTAIASFWLNGTAAAFTTWKKLVNDYLTALDEYHRTNSEESLKKFFNNDLGEPYYPKSDGDVRFPEHLKSMAFKLPEREIPESVRFLVANVDVQRSSFIVQVHGISPGTPFDITVIDRFEIKKSDRVDSDNDPLPIKPASYLEDWRKIEELVMNKTYPLSDGSGRRMAIMMTSCDSGGYSKGKGESVTTKAYDFYRLLKSEGKHGRFVLIKGDSKNNQPRTRVTFPDAQKKDDKSAARGDVPVLFFNSNLLKDDLDGRLDCVEPGKGMFITPDWLSDDFYRELCAETRTPQGWKNIGGARNEAWDLAYYCIGLCISKFIRIEVIDWNNPPSWAAPWDNNFHVSSVDDPETFAQTNDSGYDFAKLAETLA